MRLKLLVYAALRYQCTRPYGTSPAGGLTLLVCVCVQVAAGGSHSCGVDEDRHLRCWGNHYDMQTVVPFPNSFLRVDAGWMHTCAIQSDQSLVCWDANDSGQCDGE
jgi:alpha-tubulin suppressor-like RCC1 family protein